MRDATLTISYRRNVSQAYAFQWRRWSFCVLIISACVLMHSFSVFVFIFCSHTNRGASIWIFWSKYAHKVHANWTKRFDKAQIKRKWKYTNDKFERWEIWCECNRFGNRWNNINIFHIQVSWFATFSPLSNYRKKCDWILWMKRRYETTWNCNTHFVCFSHEYSCQFKYEATPSFSLVSAIEPFVIGWTESKLYSKHNILTALDSLFAKKSIKKKEHSGCKLFFFSHFV